VAALTEALGSAVISCVRAGDALEVVVDTERIHFFDPATGEAIRA
jgi:hypothetical protein